VVVGEDLGTVPESVRISMRRHGLHRSGLFAFHASRDGKGALSKIPEASLAGLNTHDMATFAGWWKGRDIDDRLRSGLLSPDEAEHERASRAAATKGLGDYLRRNGLLEGRPTRASVFRAAVAFLARSPARAVMIALEDLWGEERPQNVPGTSSAERPNWRGKARLPLREAARSAAVIRSLRMLDRLRGSSA
jgi:4-alpha-glucanotransferase